jgi:hypothetical protein
LTISPLKTFSDVGDAAMDGMSDDLNHQFSRARNQLLSAHDIVERVKKDTDGEIIESSS